MMSHVSAGALCVCQGDKGGQIRETSTPAAVWGESIVSSHYSGYTTLSVHWLPLCLRCRCDRTRLCSRRQYWVWRNTLPNIRVHINTFSLGWISQKKTATSCTLFALYQWLIRSRVMYVCERCNWWRIG